MDCTPRYAQLSPSGFLKMPLFTLMRTADYVLFLLNESLIYYFDVSLGIVQNFGTSKCSWNRNVSKSAHVKLALLVIIFGTQYNKHSL